MTSDAYTSKGFRQTPSDATEQVASLSRRTAHVTHALLVCAEEERTPARADEIVIYDSEAINATSTARALANAVKENLAVKAGDFWIPSLRAHDLRSALEERFLRETAEDA